MTPILDPPQVAEILKCSVRTVEDHARAGRLPGVKFGEGWVFPAEALLKAVNRMAETEAAQRSEPKRKTSTLRRARPQLPTV